MHAATDRLVQISCPLSDAFPSIEARLCFKRSGAAEGEPDTVLSPHASGLISRAATGIHGFSHLLFHSARIRCAEASSFPNQRIGMHMLSDGNQRPMFSSENLFHTQTSLRRGSVTHSHTHNATQEMNETTAGRGEKALGSSSFFRFDCERRSQESLSSEIVQVVCRTVACLHPITHISVMTRLLPVSRTWSQETNTDSPSR